MAPEVGASHQNKSSLKSSLEIGASKKPEVVVVAPTRKPHVVVLEPPMIAVDSILRAADDDDVSDDDVSDDDVSDDVSDDDDDGEEQDGSPVDARLRALPKDAARLRALLDTPEETAEAEVAIPSAPSLDELLRMCDEATEKTEVVEMLQGFICPQCLMVAPTQERLKSHFEAVHLSTWKDAAGRREGDEGYRFGDASRALARRIVQASAKTKRTIRDKLQQHQQQHAAQNKNDTATKTTQGEDDDDDDEKNRGDRRTSNRWLIGAAVGTAAAAAVAGPLVAGGVLVAAAIVKAKQPTRRTTVAEDARGKETTDGVELPDRLAPAGKKTDPAQANKPHTGPPIDETAPLPTVVVVAPAAKEKDPAQEDEVFPPHAPQELQAAPDDDDDDDDEVTV